MSDDVHRGVPINKFELTIKVYGNSHEELFEELRSVYNNHYHMDTEYGERDNYVIHGGRSSRRLKHTNPNQTPEKYKEELDAWADHRKMIRKT